MAGGWIQSVSSAFANNGTNLLTIPSSHLPNHYFSVASWAPSSCDPLFCPAEVSKWRGAMSKGFFLHSGDLCMSSLCPNSTEERSELPATSKLFLGQSFTLCKVEQNHHNENFEKLCHRGSGPALWGLYIFAAQDSHWLQRDFFYGTTPKWIIPISSDDQTRVLL